MEGLRLRIKDVEFDRHVVIVREAKGNKDRVVMLPLHDARPFTSASRAPATIARCRTPRPARHR